MATAKTQGTSAIKPNVKYTLEDYRKWPDEERWELIDGIAYTMSPAPRLPHQKLVFALAKAIDAFLDGKKCQVIIAPIDVFLFGDDPTPGPEDDLDGSVVQPDVLVVCDPLKIKDDGIHGAPDFVAEILSDSTAYKDLNQKKDLYERAGVKEYWIVKPSDGSVLAWRLEGSRFAPVKEYRSDEPVDSEAINGFVWKR